MAIKHEESQHPNKKPSSQTRRSVLKKILVGTGVAAGAAALPEKWMKPMVDKVLVPAHAQTIGADEFEGGGGVTENKMGTLVDENGIYENQIFIIGKVLGGIAYLDFQTRCPFYGCEPRKEQIKIYSGFAQPSVQSIPPGYHYEYKVDLPVGAKMKADVVFVRAAGECDKPGDTHGSAAFVAYTPGELLTVEVWGTEYTLDPVNPAALPGLTGCAEESDIRLKTDIHPLGPTSQGFKLYRFRYIEDPAELEYVGVMAQDLAVSHPHALVQNDNGYYAVRYDLLGLKMTTYKEWRQTGLNAVELVN